MIIESSAKLGHSTLALDFYSLMRLDHLQPPLPAFTCLIDCCTKAGDFHSAWLLLAELRSFNLQPDNFTYAALFKGIKHETHVSYLNKALDIWQDISSNNNSDGVKPDEIVFNVLLDACINCK